MLFLGTLTDQLSLEALTDQLSGLKTDNEKSEREKESASVEEPEKGNDVFS